jgi:hypothetical protein
MSTELAEKTMMEKAALVKIYDQHYFGGKYGNRKFRVSEFSGKVSELRFLSLDGKVFEVQAEPKPKM